MTYMAFIIITLQPVKVGNQAENNILKNRKAKDNLMTFENLNEFLMNF